MTHVGEALELPTLVIADDSVQQHPLGPVQLPGRHGDLDVLVKHGAPWWRDGVSDAKGFSHDQDNTLLSSLL